MTKPNRIFLAMAIALALLLANGVNAFAPSFPATSRNNLPVLFATVPKEEDRPPKQNTSTRRQIQPRPIGIIRPLGGNDKFDYKQPLKQFPTHEMRERFRKTHGYDSVAENTRLALEANPFPDETELLPQSVPIQEPAVEAAEAAEGAITEMLEEEAGEPVVPCPPLLWANGEYFATDDLAQILHQNADVGEPLESSRTLADKIPATTKEDETATEEPTVVLSCGSASCTPGGWRNRDPQSETEAFYLLKGFGCLTDIDGTRHYFGPGDTVVVPPGWSGRWDVAEDLHRIWFVLDREEEIAEKDTEEMVKAEGEVIRATVIHYHELVNSKATTNDEILAEAGDPPKSETTLGTMESLGLALSCITCALPTPPVPLQVPPRKYVDCFHLLEGSMVLIPSGADEEDSCFCIASGDTVVLPQGWTGSCEVLEPIKALRVRA